MLWGSAILSFVLAFVVLRILLARFARFALDTPNQRSLHATPVPRTGGLGVLVGLAAALPLVGWQFWVPVALALLLGAVSLADDLAQVPNRVRLFFHFAAAAVIVWYLLSPMHPLELLLLFLAVVWITNLYNFMDGADGVAGGMAVIGFAAYAIAAWQAGTTALAALCAALASASLAGAATPGPSGFHCLLLVPSWGTPPSL